MSWICSFGAQDCLKRSGNRRLGVDKNMKIILTSSLGGQIKETLYGEAYSIKDGVVNRICMDGEKRLLDNGTCTDEESVEEGLYSDYTGIDPLKEAIHSPDSKETWTERR